MRRLRRLAASVAFALLAATGTAHGADRITVDPLARESQVEVSSPGVVEVEVGPFDEFVIVEARGIEVSQAGPTSLTIDARTPSSRAVVLVGAGGAYRTVVISTAGPVPSEPAPTAEVASEYAAYAAVGGDYTATGIRDTWSLSLYHWADWRQRLGATDVGAYVGVLALPGGPVTIPDVLATVDRPTWGVALGDVDVLAASSVSGFQGAGAPLRGGSAYYAPGGGPGWFGVVGGVGRVNACCEFFVPERLWMAAATGGWRPRRGVWAEGLAGVMKRDVDTGLTPLGNVRVGYDDRRVHLAGEVAQSGPGTSVTVKTRGLPSEALTLYAEGGWSSAGFRRPFAREDFGMQAAGLAGLEYRYRTWLTFDVSAYGQYRERSSLTPEALLIGGDAMVRWTPTRRFGASLGYRRYQNTIEGTGFGGDGISGSIYVLPIDTLTLSTSGSVTFGDGGLAGAYASAGTGWRPTRHWRFDATWHGAFTGAQVDTVMHAGNLGASYSTDRIEWGLGTGLNVFLHEGTTDTNVSAGTALTWHVRRFLSLGAGAHAGYNLPTQIPTWRAEFNWTLRPTEFGEKRGGLGFQGATAGSVYLDVNRNGVRDDSEDGVPGVSITVDGEKHFVSDDDGRFQIGSLSPGDHTFEIERGAFHSLGPTHRVVDVIPLRRNVIDFGVTWGGRVQGLLYDDVHGNDRFDNGDPGVVCETVSLRNAQGIVIDRVYAEGGRFVFSGLAEGEYTVMVDSFGLPEGYVPVDDLEPSVFVEEGKAVNVHIRLHANRAIGGVVWEDTDKDGVGGGKKDLGIGGAEVYLSTGEVVRSGPDGSFLFRDLGPGAYAVRTELGTEAKVVVLPVEPKEVLDLTFVLPKGTRPPEQNVNPSPKAPDSVAGLVLEAPISVLPQGIELQVTATAVLSNGETREVTTRANWSSSDPATLHVSPEGKVSGHAAGTAGVTAEWKGGLGDPLTFEVLGSPLDRITVSPVGLRLNPGNTADLRVDVVDRSGRGGEVTPVAVWEVADTRVARIDAAGRLKAVRDGITTVRARIGDTWSAPLEVQVITAQVTALSIENLPARMPEGATVQLKATGYDTRLEIQNVTESVTWTSSDPNVVRVEPDGRIIAVGRGTAQITAAIGSLFTRSRTVFVTNTPPLALEVVPPGMTLSIYDLQRFRATATFEDGSTGAVTTVVEWLVEGNAALVRADGTVVPREPGTVTIRARYLGVESAPVVVTVTQ